MLKCQHLKDIKDIKKKGDQNILNREAKKMFYDTIEGLVPKVKEAFDIVFETNPEKALDLYQKYASFVMPKKVDITTDGQQLTTPLINWVTGQPPEEEEAEVIEIKENVKLIKAPKQRAKPKRNI